MSHQDEKTVECGLHGATRPAYVCRHLDLHRPVGFVEGYDPEDPEREIFHAWCSRCDEVMVREGGWNDRSEAFAGVRLVCRECFRTMRSINREIG